MGNSMDYLSRPRGVTRILIRGRQEDLPGGPLLLLPSIFPSIRVLSNESTLCIRWLKYWSFSISPSSEYSGLIFFRIALFCSPCRPRNSQESSPTPQFKSINTSVLSLLYGPVLTSVHDYWKKHSLDFMALCWQSDVSAFKHTV